MSSSKDLRETVSTESNSEEQFSLREQLDRYLIHWKWFVVGIFASLIIAFLYLRYSTNIYKASALIMIKDEKRGGGLSELAAFSDLGLLSGVKNSTDNEVEVLRSRTLVENTIKKLNLDISYLNQGRVKSFDIYNESPIRAHFIEIDEEYKDKYFSFTIVTLTPSSFEIDSEELNLSKKYTFGETIHNEFGSFIITRNKEVKSTENNKSIIVEVNSVKRAAESYRRALSVEPLGKYTSVISLSVTNNNKQKAEDFLDTLIDLYNEDAVNDRKYISEKTSLFINERLKIISQELGDVENQAEDFKKVNQITDIPTQASLYLQNTSEFDKKIIDIEIKIGIIDTVIESFDKKNSEGDIIPIDLLPSETNAGALISELNKVVLQREKMAKNAGADNTVFKDLNHQITVLKSSLKESLLRTKSNLNITLKDLQGQKAFLSGKITQIPSLEKEARIITRQQNIKEALYLYLLQKREETEISMAAIAPNAKIIDRAVASDIPVSPKKNMIYLVALILGGLIPFSVLYIKDLLDTKVKYTDIAKLLSLPYLGDVPRSETNFEVVSANSRTSSAEALRIIRTNMDFILSQSSNQTSKVIFVTSTIPKEGKTFIAVNLAATFALSGKKTLLIGMDIRNPKIEEYLKLPSRGVTNYLASEDLDMRSIITKIDNFKEFYVMAPGIIPPNPAELLMSPKVKEMFEELRKEYDYIIVDTAPVSLVTDTMLIAKNADAFVYVVRENYLDKHMLELPEKLYLEKKLPNMSVLLNDTFSKKTYRRYGYGYGKYLEQAKKPWYKKIFKS